MLAYDVAAVVFGLKFADNIRYKFKSSEASKARLRRCKRTGAKQFFRGFQIICGSHFANPFATSPLVRMHFTTRRCSHW